MENLLEEYEKMVRETAVYPNVGSNLTYPVLGLSGEAGEVANKVKKIQRDEGGEITFGTQINILRELGDVLWYVVSVAHEIGLGLEDVISDNLIKLQDRKRRGTLHGSGDDR